ncbi:MAG TPA: hypothetical protein PLV37_02835 [Bacillota bacterium]|nr:hypothetical protein [Bacillota bacterium]
MSDVAARAIADLKATENSISSKRGNMGRNSGAQGASGLSGNYPGQGKVIAKSFSDDLIQTGRINLTGNKFNDVSELAAFSHVYREPRFETFRIIYTKGYEIVGTDAVSSRLPSMLSIVLNPTSNGKQDKSMANPEDVARMPCVLKNFDSVELLKNKDGNVERSKIYTNSKGEPAPSIRYHKRINGLARA